MSGIFDVLAISARLRGICDPAKIRATSRRCAAYSRDLNRDSIGHSAKRLFYREVVR